MEIKVYVVTNPENGWDCVSGVYGSFKSLKKFFLERFFDSDEPKSKKYKSIKKSKNIDELMECIDSDPYIIHDEYLNT